VIYADDTTLSTTINYFNEDGRFTNIEDNINTEIEKVTDWLKLKKLSLNVKKTKAMLFHTVQRKVKVPNLIIEGSAVVFVKEFNFLGIVLDSSLKWKKHIDFISNKINRISGIFYRLKRFLPENILLMLYNSLVLPHLNYGVLLWGCNVTRLEKLQKKDH
jgi:hypothetical protein